MSVFWALFALLYIHTGGVSGQLLPPAGNYFVPYLPTPEFDLPLSTTNLQSLPRTSQSLPALLPPVPGVDAVPKSPSQPKKKPQKDPAETNGQNCDASAWYFISKKKVDDYLNDTIPEAIKAFVNCAELGLTGIVKMVLESADLDKMLEYASVLGLGGDGNPFSGLTSSFPLPISGMSGGPFDSLPDGLPGISGSSALSFASNSFGNVKKLITAFGGANNILSESGKPLEGKNPGDLLESHGLDKSEDLANTIKKAASSGPNEISGVDLGALQENPAKIGHLLENLDLKLHASDIVIKNITITTEDSFINVQAYVEADITGSDDLLGSVTDLMGFQMGITVELIIGPGNGTKCIFFEILEKKMKVEEMKIKIIDRIKRELKEPIPIPLDSIVPALLMVNVSSPEGECELTLKNPTCINERAVLGKGVLFFYHQKTANFTSKGLLASYCAEINSKDKRIPVAGGPSPPIPEDVDASLVLFSSIVKAVITDVVKESSVKSKEGELKVKTISYKLLNKKALLNIHSDLKENGISTASVYSRVNLSHSCVVSNGYLLGNVNLLSAEHEIEPTDNKVAKEIGKQMVSKLVSKINEFVRRMNVPPGPEIELLNNAPVQVDSQGDLVASK